MKNTIRTFYIILSTFLILGLSSGLVYAQDVSTGSGGGFLDTLRGGLSRLVTLNNPVELNDPKSGFGFSETPRFSLSVPQKNTQRMGKEVTSKWDTKEEKIEATVIYKADNKKIPAVIQKTDEGQFQVRINQKEGEEFARGEYQLQIEARESFIYERNLTQDFSWGVLAVNTNKSIFQPNEEALISFGVLNKNGNTICNAKITITIGDPDRNEKTMSSSKGDIKHSPECGDNYSEIPDYSTTYKVGKAGRYFMHVTADNGAGEHSITDFFDVKENISFTVERIKFPTRIYPPSGYPVEIKVTAHEDYNGKVFDTVPASFVISDISNNGQAPQSKTVKEARPDEDIVKHDLEVYKDIPKLSKTLWQDSNSIVSSDHHKPMPIEWNVAWKRGQTYTLSYTINFPNVSPEYYLLGPFIVGDHSFSEAQGAIDPKSDSKAIVMNNALLEQDKSLKFFEVRQWQVASDANRCWAGTVDANWNTALNWVSTAGAAVTLTANDVAIFDSSATTCSSGSTANASTLNTSTTVDGVRVLTYANTITQTNGADLTLDNTTGWIQSAASSVFTGGDSTSDIEMTNAAGDFNQTDGTFTAPAGTITVLDNFISSGGTFNHNSGTVTMDTRDEQDNLTGPVTFNNLTLVSGCNNGGRVSLTGTITTIGTLTLDADTDICRGQLLGTGSLSAKGDVTLIDYGFLCCEGLGPVKVLTFNGTGNQTLTGAATCPFIPSVVINKPSGKLTLISCIDNSSAWTYIAGALDPGTSTLGFNVTASQSPFGNYSITGTATYYNVDFYAGCNNGGTATIPSGTTITVTGTLTFWADTCNLNVDGPGSLVAKGNISTTESSGGVLGGDIAIRLTGSADQTITPASANFPSGTFTIAKGGGEVALGADFSVNTSGQDMTITSGVLDTGTYNLTVNDTLTINGQFNQGSGNVVTGASGEITVGSTGIYMNQSTGDITIGAAGSGFANAGYVRFDGGGVQCGDTDSISIATTTSTTARDWSGAGTYILIDTTVRDANDSGITITAYNSTLTSNSDWVFNSGCPTYSNRSVSNTIGGTNFVGGSNFSSN